MEIYDLTTEGRTDPMGLDVQHPAFSWKMRGAGCMQKSYRIAVASDPSLLETPDLWDSGVVFSERSLWIPYAGSPLHSHKAYFWQVTVNGVLSPVARFEIAFTAHPMKKSDWIGMPLSNSGYTDICRLDFTIQKQVRSARLYVAALGCARCYCNGTLLDDAYFDGAISVYRKRVYYRTYALSLRTGHNAVAVELGYGFYGAKKLKAEVYIEYADGTHCVLPTIAGRLWNVTRGCITRNSVYGGEVYDARLRKPWFSPDYPVDTSEFAAAYVTDPPAGKLCACPIPPMRVKCEWEPVSVTRTPQGSWIVDAGKNVTGWVRIALAGARGTRVICRYAEICNSDGSVNMHNLRTAESADTYILCGDGREEYAPSFTYHGFRYVEIVPDGNVELLGVTACHVRSDLKQVGTFACSDDTLNRLHEIAARTEANNLNGTFTDCPQRDERLAWLNDMTARIYQSQCNFDLSLFLPAFIDMITDSQNENGEFGDTVPFFVGSPLADPVSAYHVLGWEAYRNYGDRRVLERNYNGFAKWTERLAQTEQDGVVNFGIYGDWCPPKAYALGADATHSALVTPEFVSAAYSIWYLRLMVRFADILQKPADAAKYRESVRVHKQAFLRKYYHAESGKIGNGSQTECAVTMTAFSDDPELCRRLAATAARDVADKGYHTTCGNQGYRHLLYRLADWGYADDVVTLLRNPDYPGWGHMLACGATTVWERWETDPFSDMHSFNHPMFGSYDGFLYNYLGGIRTEACRDAFGKIVIEPCFVSVLTYAETSLDTVRGKISVRWERVGDEIELHVSTPANTTLCVRTPGYTGRCGGETYTNELHLTNGAFTVKLQKNK